MFLCVVALQLRFQDEKEMKVAGIRDYKVQYSIKFEDFLMRERPSDSGHVDRNRSEDWRVTIRDGYRRAIQSAQSFSMPVCDKALCILLVQLMIVPAREICVKASFLESLRAESKSFYYNAEGVCIRKATIIANPDTLLISLVFLRKSFPFSSNNLLLTVARKYEYQ